MEDHSFIMDLTPLAGDVFGLGTSALQCIRLWPGFLDRLRSKALDPVLHFYKYDGTSLADIPHVAPEGWEPGITLSRAHAHNVRMLLSSNTLN